MNRADLIKLCDERIEQLKGELKLMFMVKTVLEEVPAESGSTAAPQRTLEGYKATEPSSNLPIEFIEEIEPGRSNQSLPSGKSPRRTRKARENWNHGIVAECYTEFLKILGDSPDGAPVTHIVKLTGCKNTMNAYAAALGILRNFPLDYVYVVRKPWPQANKKLRGIMSKNRAIELGLKIIEKEEKEVNINGNK